MNWELTTIGEHCTVTSSKRFHLSERCKDGIPFYCSKEIIQKVNGQEVTDCDYISEEVYEQVKKQFGVPETGDLLITTRGTYGIPYIYSKTDRFYFADGNLTWLKEFDKYLLPQYLYFWVLSYEGQKKIDAIAKGTAQKAVPIASIKSISLRLPCIRIQQKIVDILSAYDDLIENNRKQIKLLEEAAQRLYKEWFVDLRFPGWETTEIVDGVPVGWKKVPVGDVLKKIPRTKQIPTAGYLQDGNIPVIDQSRNFIAGYTNDTEAMVTPDEPIIVFGDHTRILKLISFPFAKGADGTQLVVSGERRMPQRLLYCSLVNVDLSNYHYARHFKYLKAEEILVPTSDIANAFEQITTGIFLKIDNCREQATRASQARDRLLPKLMSGELEV